ncbi:DUF6069 family protein [Actinomadura sp. NAK00032]|uniref:DUF6069 family protein n=1 Tax=Actinomadura sp. NAK00032 TaxID=2742128 RepID=UPI0034A12DA0
MKECSETTTFTRPAAPGLRRHAYAVGGTVLATALLWAAARRLGVEPHVDPGDGRPAQVVGLPLTAGVTLVVSLLASATRAVLDGGQTNELKGHGAGVPGEEDGDQAGSVFTTPVRVAAAQPVTDGRDRRDVIRSSRRSASAPPP